MIPTDIKGLTALLKDMIAELESVKSEMSLVKTEISGGFRTDKGTYVFARIKGVISTVRKQNKNVFLLLKNAYQNHSEKIDFLLN
jgi:cystathionine beta-lyase family protein involved in aluminum resistance